MSNRLTAGDTAPDFTLDDSKGNAVSLSDYRGENVVVYFYPAASTPGCTTEACDFRDNLNSLKSAGYTVLGVSPDPIKKIAKFADDQSLNFPLLSDEDHSVAEAWGAWGEKNNYGKVSEGLIRSTVVVDGEDKVSLAQYNVRAKGHVDKLRRNLGID